MDEKLAVVGFLSQICAGRHVQADRFPQARQPDELTLAFGSRFALKLCSFAFSFYTAADPTVGRFHPPEDRAKKQMLPHHVSFHGSIVDE